MSLPDVTITIADPALGLAPPDTSRQQAKVGVCSLGTNNQVYTFGDPVALAAALGRGPLVDAALDTLIATGQPVVCVPVESDVAGAVSSVTHAGTGTGTAAISGTPNDSFDLIVKFVTGAANLAALPTFKYSLDSGRTYSGVITAAASYAIPNTGMTLGLTNGSGTSWVAGDTYSFTCTAPGATATKYMAAVDALLADSSEWFMCHLVGVQADTSTAATFFATLDSKATAMEAAYRYAFFLMELPEDTDANIKTSFTSLAASSKRVAVAAGMCALASKLTAARIARLTASGQNAFDEYQVPTAALTLKQGFGRLIRTATDTGIVVLFDPRVLTKPFTDLQLKHALLAAVEAHARSGKRA